MLRCSVCSEPAKVEAHPKDAAFGSRPVAVCGEVCLMKHIEAKRRNRGGQDREDIDPEDRENEDADAATGSVTTGYGRTIRPGGLDPSVAPAPGVSLALKQYKPAPEDGTATANRDQEIEPLGDYQDDPEDGGAYAPGTPDFTQPRPDVQLPDINPASPMYIDLSGEDDEPSFDGPVDGGTIAPASPDDMVPRKKAPIVIDLTEDAEPLPADEEPAVAVVDPLSGQVYLDGPLATSEERENEEDDNDDGMRTKGPPPPFPAPAALPSENKEDFMRPRRLDDEEVADQTLLGQRQLYAPDDANYARINNAVMATIHKWLSVQHHSAKRGVEELGPIALWTVRALKSPAADDPQKRFRPVYLVIYIARTRSRELTSFQQRLGMANPFYQLENMLENQPELRFLPSEQLDPKQYTKMSVELLVIDGNEHGLFEMALDFGTKDSDLYAPHPRFPKRKGQISHQNVASFLEKYFLHPYHEFLPSDTTQRIKGPLFSLGLGERSLSEKSPTWMFWSAAEHAYTKKNDNFHWTTDNVDTKNTDPSKVVRPGPTFRQKTDDDDQLGLTGPFTSLFIAAVLRGVERNRGGIRAAMGAYYPDTGFTLRYGPTPFHIYELFRETKQFDPSIHGQRARDLRRHYQSYILRTAAKTLADAGYTGDINEAIYSYSPYLPNLGGLVWHGTQTPQLISGEWVIKDGSFFSFDSEMSARYAAANRVGLDAEVATPAMLCYQIAAPLPKRMINYRCVPLPVKPPPDACAEPAYDLYFTGRLFDIPFWKCFGQIPGYFTPQAETICKVWGTGLVIHMAQSVGSVMEEVANEIPKGDPKYRRKFLKEDSAVNDRTLYCRAGVELVLAHPRRYLRRKLRPAIDAIITTLRAVRMGRAHDAEYYGEDKTSQSDYGRNYGYADILSILYHDILDAGWGTRDRIGQARRLPPFAKFALEHRPTAAHLEFLSWQAIKSQAGAHSLVFANVNLTHAESDTGVRYQTPRNTKPSDAASDFAVPYTDKFLWAFPSCLVVGGTPFFKRLTQFKIDERQQFLMVDAAAVDIAFREALLSFYDDWTIYSENLEIESEGGENVIVKHLFDLLTEGFTYDKESGRLAPLGAPARRQLGTERMAEFNQEVGSGKDLKEYEESLKKGGNIRHNLLFNFRDYLYLVQAPADSRMGAGNIGVKFDEASRVYGSDNIPRGATTAAYGFSHNDPSSYRAALRNYRGVIPGVVMKKDK